MSRASELSCGNCSVEYGPDDIFCENCGYDFITGSLPGPNEQFTLLPAPEAKPDVLFPDSPVSSPILATSSSLRIGVAVDLSYFEPVVSEGELDFPDPVPVPIQLVLTGQELHIGRRSDSRAIHPDIDVADLTGDPAVSSRHAIIRVGADGAITVTDVGSTNGTYVGSYDSSSISIDVAVSVDPDIPIFVGAWTRLQISSGQS